MDIKATIAQMTLEEKASLLSGLDFWHTKPVERLGVKPCMVSDGPHGLRKQDDQGDHLGINDSIKAVCFPAACASTASFDRDLVRQIGENIGDACQHERLSVVLGPAVNIKRSPLCGRNFEYLSEDPYLAGELSVSIINGIQSRNVGTSIKHFAANSQEHRRMSSDSVVDERALREIYFPAFEQAVKRAQPWTVMCSYNKLNGEYASQNKWLLTDVLRKEWGFEGYVVSDWGAVSDRVKGVAAGLDLEMPSSGGVNDALVVEAVKAGALDEKLVDQAVERILTINQRYLDNARPDTPWDKDAQHELARQLAADCIVLLKNDEQILPVKPAEKLAVVGEFAVKPRFQGGGSSHINSCKITSLMDALADRPGVTYAQGYQTRTEEPDEALMAEAVAAAKAADKVIVMAGLPDSFESEGYDRTHMRMPRCQVALIEAVAAVNPNVIVVLHNGSPVEMPWLGSAKAVLEAYLGGQAVGGAVADVLTGKVNPSARLPESFPVRLEDSSAYLTYGGEGNTAVYSEGIFVGYRYYDKKKTELLFPFGYGMSYTSFAYSNLTVSSDSIRDTDTLTVTVDVTNTGAVAGKEVVQLYVRDIESSVLRPVRELKEFAKVELAPGETKTVSFTLGKRAFAYWSKELHDWHVETGDFAIEIARSSRDIVLTHEVKVESTVRLPRHYSLDTIMMDLIKDPEAMAKIGPVMQKVHDTLGGEETEGTDAAKEAITEEMNAAMMAYMPLRGALSFGDPSIRSALLAAISELNGEE